MRKFLLIVLLAINYAACYSQSLDNKKYLDQLPPGDSAILFAPGIISDGFGNRDFAISPEGNEIFYTIQNRDFVSVIMHSRNTNGKWSQPELASFCGIYNDLEPAFASDGKRLYFSSNRPLNAFDTTPDFNIWYVDKENENWSEPSALDTIVNSEKDEFYPSIAKTGNMYFTREFDGGKGKEDIVVCEWKDGKYSSPVSLPEAINSPGFEFNAFVDPDEQFILFSGYQRSDGFGSGDLYISVRKQGVWQPAINLGKKINSEGLDYCPFVTWDKRYLFFTSNRVTYKSPFNQKQSAAEIKKALQSPGNGLDDIYWIRFDTILKTAIQ